MERLKSIIDRDGAKLAFCVGSIIGTLLVYGVLQVGDDPVMAGFGFPAYSIACLPSLFCVTCTGKDNQITLWGRERVFQVHFVHRVHEQIADYRRVCRHPRGTIRSGCGRTFVCFYMRQSASRFLTEACLAVAEETGGPCCTTI